MSQSFLFVPSLQLRLRRLGSLGDDGQYMYEVTRYVGRRKRHPADEGEYELWVVAVLRPLDPGAACPRVPSASEESAEHLRENLQDAIADVAAGRVADMIWKADDLPGGTAAALIGLPDKMEALVDEPLGTLASGAGVPPPAASFTGDVAGVVLLKPVLKPVQSAVHGLEIAGAIVGLLTGMHPLVVTCVKHLIRDELSDMLAKAFSQVITDATIAADHQLSAAASPQAADEPISDAAPVAAHHSESGPPRTRVIDTATGLVRREGHVAGEVADAVRVTASTEAWRSLRDAVEGASGDQSAIEDPHGHQPPVSGQSSRLAAI